ncbi:hypothetical protein EVAR_99496_1 [Eumeta japonica]|uniref:Uncharacterized protein n=1 Tax=Eumeta variegata TaxID=151549 RepID=A0A4C1Z191_EUMVA|nr:hypothetical protein EVAR_99496_1 [Eumeta japonica]
MKVSRVSNGGRVAARISIPVRTSRMPVDFAAAYIEENTRYCCLMHIVNTAYNNQIRIMPNFQSRVQHKGNNRNSPKVDFDVMVTSCGDEKHLSEKLCDYLNERKCAPTCYLMDHYDEAIKSRKSTQPDNPGPIIQALTN